MTQALSIYTASRQPHTANGVRIAAIGIKLSMKPRRFTAAGTFPAACRTIGEQSLNFENIRRITALLSIIMFGVGGGFSLYTGEQYEAAINLYKEAHDKAEAAAKDCNAYPGSSACDEEARLRGQAASAGTSVNKLGLMYSNFMLFTFGFPIVLWLIYFTMYRVVRGTLKGSIISGQPGQPGQGP